MVYWFIPVQITFSQLLCHAGHMRHTGFPPSSSARHALRARLGRARRALAATGGRGGGDAQGATSDLGNSGGGFLFVDLQSPMGESLTRIVIINNYNNYI